MRWLKRDRWKAGIAIAGMLLLLVLWMWLLVLIVWVPVSAAGAYERVSGLAGPGTATVQATPTEDATVTALNKEKLTQEVAQQQHTLGNWFWNNGAAVISSLVLVIAGAFTLFRYLRDQRSEREKQREDHQTELEKRAEERFQSAVEGLGSEREEAKIGAAILLRTFLRPGYEQFYTQTFDLAVAHLRLRRTSHPPEDPDGIPPPPDDPTTPLPLTTLRQALIVVFKEAFPLARDKLLKEQAAQRHPIRSQSLDATGIQLDNAFLDMADLKQAWMPGAFLRRADLNLADLREADLIRANLREAALSGAILDDAFLNGATLKEATLNGAGLRRADLRGADLRGADLREADLSEADLHWADLSGVEGLTKEQLERCKAEGAIIDEDTTTSPPQSPVSPPPPSQSNDAQAQSAPPAQGSTLTPDTGDSSTTPSKPSNGVQAQSVPSAQESIPTPDIDRSSAASSQQGPGGNKHDK